MSGAIRLTFLGAAGTVTGSRHLVEWSGKRLLVDCGMFQGMRELRELNWKAFPVDIPRVDAGLPTPRLGTNERLSMAAWLLWIAVLAIKLLRSSGTLQVVQRRRLAAP